MQQSFQDPYLRPSGDKDEMFDNFLADLFTNNLKLDLKKMGLGPSKNGAMALDKSLMITTAKR
jgi:hypothetical protein